MAAHGNYRQLWPSPIQDEQGMLMPVMRASGSAIGPVFPIVGEPDNDAPTAPPTAGPVAASLGDPIELRLKGLRQVLRRRLQQSRLPWFFGYPVTIPGGVDHRLVKAIHALRSGLGIGPRVP